MTRPDEDPTLTQAEDTPEETEPIHAHDDVEGAMDSEAAAEEADPAAPPETPELAEEQEAEAELRSEAEQVQAEMAELHDRHLRLRAEFDNYRRRAQGELTESWVRAQADLVRRLLDPIDDIKRVSALDLSNATVEAIMEGIDLVERKVMRALEEAGLEEIDPEGEPFDPNIMEAMMRVPTESLEEDDRVDQVFLKGYSLKGHLVRPARVSVLKHDA